MKAIKINNQTANKMNPIQILEYGGNKYELL